MPDEHMFVPRESDEFCGALVLIYVGTQLREVPCGGGRHAHRSWCECDWLGVGTPRHLPSPMCIALRPDGPRSA